MTRFMGTHVNRLDRKGRVSVPAQFRAELARAETDEMVFRPSHQKPCIEAWPAQYFDQMAASLENYDVFSEERDELAATLYADAHPMRPDSEGRIMLPEALIIHAGLAESIAFVGLGRIFQIWDPDAAKNWTSSARGRAQEKGLTLSGRPPAPRAEGSA